MIPTRIQHSPAEGGIAPAGTLDVDNFTVWGNPFVVGEQPPQTVRIYADAVPTALFKELAGNSHFETSDFMRYIARGEEVPDKATANRLYRAWLLDLREARPKVFESLFAKVREAKHLLCWCAPGDECHADVWIELAQEADNLQFVLDATSNGATFASAGDGQYSVDYRKFESDHQAAARHLAAGGDVEINDGYYDAEMGEDIGGSYVRGEYFKGDYEGALQSLSKDYPNNNFQLIEK